MEMHTWRNGMMLAALVGMACSQQGIDQNGLAGQAPQQSPPLTGAIFTTTADGTAVNANQYGSHCEVYLNGGPQRDGSAGLPAGDYYFQVTGPGGGEAEELLSNDDISRRQISVDESGRFTGVSGAGNHMTGENLVDGGATIQLCPFLPTSNPGCVYKVWVTPVGDYDPDAPQGTFGFLPNRSKTDNFRVCPKEPGDDDDDEDDDYEEEDEEEEFEEEDDLK
jgi:hypothetical protein